LVGNTSSSIKNSTHFINEIKHLKLDPNDILVRFDVKYLCTNIPIDEAMKVVHKITNYYTAKLIEVCLKSTFFSFKDEIYEQTYTEQYLHVNSHHHPSQKNRVLNTLSTRVVCISNHDHFEKEKNYLMDEFEKNGYKKH